MKRVLLVIISLLVISGCGCSVHNTARDATANYMEKYRNHDTRVLSELNRYIDNEDLTTEQKDIYREVLKKQYKDLKYEIVDERYEDDSAVVSVKVTVYDLYQAQKDAEEYLNNNREAFNDIDGNYDASKFMDYKLNVMKEYEEKIEHIVDIELEKNDSGNWVVTQLTDEDLEKIHGVYTEV